MKVTVPEISFHNRDPILSVDIQPHGSDGIIRMATGGTDAHVVVWQISPLPSGGVSVEALSELVRHTKAVNAVRFSPDGNFLASGDDDSAIILWRRQDNGCSSAPDLFGEDSEVKNKEHWVIHKLLRGHIQDVCDLCWSSCSNFLVSGSIDNSAIIWDIAKGKNIGLLKEHKNFVQGVAWDPKGQYVATLSSDRLLRWFSISNKRTVHKAQKATLPQVKPDGTVKEIATRLFYDDTLKSFCRRLAFSPDGLLLVAPSGVLEGEEPGTRAQNAVHIFTRLSPSSPVMYLPTKDKYTLAVRFCPLLFKLRSGRKNSPYNGQSVFDLPYRMVFAVACQNSVIIYDTQQLLPFAKMSNMHYTRLTDLTWSSDGRILALSSTDGYCSLAYFDDGELGEIYSPGDQTDEPLEAKGNIPASPKSTERIKKSSDEPSSAKKIKEDSNAEPKIEDSAMDVEKCEKKSREEVEGGKKLRGADTTDDIKNDDNKTDDNKSGADKEVISANASAPSDESRKEEFLRSIQVKKVKPVNILVPRRAPKPDKSSPKLPPGKSLGLQTKSEDNPHSGQSTPKDLSKSEPLKSISEDSVAGPSKEPSDSEDCESIGSRDSEEEGEDQSDLSMISKDDDDDDDDLGVKKIDLGEEDSDEEMMDVDEKSEEDLDDFDDNVDEKIEDLDDSDDNVDESEDCEDEVKDDDEADSEDIGDEDSEEDLDGESSDDENDDVIQEKSENNKKDPKNGIKSSGSSTEKSPAKVVQKVNLIAVKRKPEPANKPGRRVPLISVPLKSSSTKLSTSEKQACSEMAPKLVSDDTEDLCLQLDGEPTVTSPIKQTPGSPKKAVGTPSISSDSKTGPFKAEKLTPQITEEKPTPQITEEKAGVSSSSGSSITPSRPCPVFAPNSKSKTPRRVALITLSSPKAKRSLLPDQSVSSNVVAKALQDK